MMPQYTQQQIIYTLNSIANTPSGRHGTVEQIEKYSSQVIAEILSNKKAIQLIGDWNIVWGPKVFQASDSTVADNAMYIAQNAQSPNNYVVAISGTNPISAYGWLVEDADLIPTVAWPYNTESSIPTGKISNGTNKGMHILMHSLQDGGDTLSQFLAKRVSASDAPLVLTITGHSLGGALSPAIALALLDTQGEDSGWDPKSTSTIDVLPSAGPTPGNIVWRDYYDKRLGQNTDRIWNAIDIVPHAWQSSMLEQIPSLYDPTIPKSNLIKKFVDAAKVNSNLAGDMQQICPNTKGLPGKVSDDMDITIRDLEIMLETLIANKIIDKLDIPKSLKGLIKTVIETWISHIKTHDHKQKYRHSKTIQARLKTDAELILKSESHLLKNFLKFLIQAGYQHTKAYPCLLGTTGFTGIVDAIKKDLA